MTMYSPHETKLFIECPTKWRLSKQWEPVGEWSPKFIYGLAVGKAFEIWLPRVFNGDLLAMEDSLAAADAIVDEGWVENDAWTADALKVVIHKGIIAATKSTIAGWLKQEEFVSVEDRLGKGEFEKGAARMDLITKRDGQYIVTDHKVKLRSRADYIEKDLIQSEHEWQFWDYAWRVSQHYNTGPLIYRVHIGVLTPTAKWYEHETNIPLELLQRWAEGARIKWEEMEVAYGRPDMLLPMHLTNCTTRYGKCEFYEACHTCGLNEDRIATFYNRKPERIKA